MPHMCAAQKRHLRAIGSGLAVALNFNFLFLSCSFGLASLAFWLSLAGLEVGIDNLGGKNMQHENHELDLSLGVGGGLWGKAAPQVPLWLTCAQHRVENAQTPPLSSWSRPLSPSTSLPALPPPALPPSGGARVGGWELGNRRVAADRWKSKR